MSRDLNVDQIKKLWILNLVIQLGSLKKASLKAKVTPSAISQTLTSLENAFGKPLLIRDKNAVTPTQDALIILDIVKPAFDAFDRLSELNGSPVPKISWINFGTYESIAIDILPGLMQSLRNKLPHLKLGLRISRTSNLLTMVRKGELCSALITEVEDLERFYVKEVAVDRLGFFVSKRLGLSHQGWSLIQKIGVGGLSPGKDGFPRYYSKFMRQSGVSKLSIMSDSFEALRAAAVSGMIVSILPHRVAKRIDDLIEIVPPSLQDKDLKEIGKHKIFIVSQNNCDREEADFLADESRRLLMK